MPSAHEVLTQIHAERAKRTDEEGRWRHYRAEVNPPLWVAGITILAALTGMLAFAAYLLGHPGALRSPLGVFIVPCLALALFARWLVIRRENAIAGVIKSEAPTLYERMKEERLVR